MTKDGKYVIGLDFNGTCVEIGIQECLVKNIKYETKLLTEEQL